LSRASKVTGLITFILMLDQALKIWVKTNMSYGDEIPIMGANWALIHFVENPGMAFGLVMNKTEGLVMLGVFLLAGIAALFHYFKNREKIETSPIFIISFIAIIIITLILGASTENTDYGKLALSLFRIVAVIFLSYFISKLIKEKASLGLLTSFSLILAGAIGNIIDSAFYGLVFSESPYHGGGAQVFPEGGGYAGFLHGKVVDMFYFPMFEGFFPSWVPFVGSEHYLFFRPVFNIADIAITTGVLSIIIFHRSFFNVKEEPKAENKVLAKNEEKETIIKEEATQEEITSKEDHDIE